MKTEEERKEAKKRSDKKWRKANPEKAAKWDKNNPEKAKLINKKSCEKYRANNPEYAKEWAKANPDKVFILTLKKYELTPYQYEQMLIEQNLSCKICGTNQLEFKKRLHVDHDHISGKIRGLLCLRCNHMLGNAKDNDVILDAASEYVKQHNKGFAHLCVEIVKF